MKILYVASAIEAGSTSGGWTHVSEVACGLRALGHDVRVIARGRTPHGKHHEVHQFVTARWPQYLALLGLPQIAREVRTFRPDVITERFYNFAGAGMLLAHRRRIPSILEVNAPMTDPPRSLKSRADILLLGAMRKWAVKQGRWAAAIVTPLRSTVPPEVPRRKVIELPWGANVEQFDPTIRSSDPAAVAALAAQLGLNTSYPVVVFLGSFRAWHGAGHFAEAARRLLMGNAPLSFLAIGGGPERAALQARVQSWNLPPGRFVFAGVQPHERIPMLLALADIGVAPFDIAAHAPLSTFGFYWSPLKVFEYMAMSLPVVTIDVTPLNEIVRHEREGLLYHSGDIAGLVRSLGRLASDADLRAGLGGNARARVTARYSWQEHCVALDNLIRQVAGAS